MTTKRSPTTDGLRRASVVFEGRVQGVGFRMTTCDVARRFRVTGYVRNAEDGSVELVAEGAEQEVARFLDALRASHVARFVRNERLDWSTAHGEFDRFSVHYG